MRILIADDSVARSTALRPLFQAAGKGSSAKRLRGKSAAAAGKLIVSCAPGRKAARRTRDEECACSGLDLGDQPEQAATTLDALGIALLNRGCLTEGAPLIELARQIRLKFFGKDHPATAASQNSYSRVLRERGDYDDAQEAAQDALRINRAVFGERGLPVAISLNELGVSQLLQGQFEDAQRSASEGIAIIDALGLLQSDPNTTRLMDVRGRAEAGQGKLAVAAATYKTLLALDRRQLGTTTHPKYATHLANFGLVKEAQKKIGQAEKDYRQAISVYFTSLNRPCHPNLIDAYANLGSLLRARNKSSRESQEAGKLLEKALRLGRQIRGESHALVGNDHANLARWQYDAGDGKAAMENFSQALRIYTRNVKRGRLPASHFYIAEALTWKGRLLVETDRAGGAAQAEPLLNDAIRIWPVQLGADTVGEAVAKACLGRALYLQGKDPTLARQLLEFAYPIILAAIGKDHELAKRVRKWLSDLNSRGSGMPPAASMPSNSRYH